MAKAIRHKDSNTRPNITCCGLLSNWLVTVKQWHYVTCGNCNRGNPKPKRRKRAEEVPERRIRVRRIKYTDAGGYKVVGEKSLTADEFVSGNWSLSLSKPKMPTGDDDGED